MKQALLALAFCCCYVGAPCVQANDKDLAPLPDHVVSKLAHEPLAGGRNSLPERLAHRLDELRALLAQGEAERSPGAGRAGLLVTDLERKGRLAGMQSEFSALRREIDGYFLDVRRGLTISKQDKPRLKAWDSLKNQVDARFDRLGAVLNDVRTAATAKEQDGARRRAEAVLRELHGRAKETTATVADHSGPGWRKDPAPALNPRRESVKTPGYLAYPAAPGNNVYAFLGNTLLAALPPATPPEAASCYAGLSANEKTAKQAADLAATTDVVIDDEIRQLAQRLDHSPAKILAWMHDNVRYEPYAGSLKGAKGTLVAGGGGPTDQASLMIALLRASNIPARYVRGSIRFFEDERLLRWLEVKDYTAAKRVLKRGAIEVAHTTDGNGNDTVTMDHVWVEACIPYGQYRGVKLSNAGHRWLPLDPSFKDKTYRVGSLNPEAFDLDAYLAGRKNGADSLPEEAYAKQVLAGLQGRNPPASLEEAADVWRVRPMVLDILPAGLPYLVASFVDWDGMDVPDTAVLPDSHRYKLNVTVLNKDGGILLARQTLSLPAIALKRITLSFRGADAAAQAQLNAWRLGTTGQGKPDLGATLPCGINVKPEIRVDGASQSVGSGSVGVCTEDNQLKLSISFAELVTPEFNQKDFRKIGAADYHALFAYAFQASDRLLRERANRLIASVRTNANPNSDPDETTGEFLHLAGIKYMRYLTDALRKVGNMRGETGASGNHLGLTSAKSKVEYLFDLPFAVSRRGFLIDIPGAESRSVSRTADQSMEWDTFLLGGYVMSAYESYIWQEMARLDSVSTVRGIQFAREQTPAIQVLKIDSANRATEVPKLVTSAQDPVYGYSNADIAAFGAWAADGYSLTIPVKKLQYDDWKGHVYIKAKHMVATGAMEATFAIDGGYNGGWTVSTPVNYNWNPILNTGYSFAQLSQSVQTNTTPPAVVSPAINYGASPHITYGADPVNLVTGNLYHVETDVKIPGRGGLGLAFERSYNSRKPVDGPLGYGWTHSYHQYLEFRDDDYDGVDEASDKDGAVSSAVWVDGSGAEKHIGMSVGPSGTSFTPPKGFYFTVAKTAAGYVLTEPDGLTYTFADIPAALDAKARLEKVSDRNGNAVRLTYDASGKLWKVADPSGRELVLDYQGGSRIRTLTDWTGRVWAYTYDAHGDLTEVHSPLALAGSQPPVRYTYYSAADGENLAHALKRYTLPRGNGMHYEYYANGRVLRHTTFPANETTEFRYNDFRRETVMINPRGLERRVYFDRHGNPVKEEAPDGAVSTFEYDTADPYLRLAATDPLGRKTRYAYHPDGKGRLKQVTLPSKLKTAGVNDTEQYLDYTAFGRPQRIQDARGNWTLLAYDARGNLIDEVRTVAGYTPTVGVTPPAASIRAWFKYAYDTYGNRTHSLRLRSFAGQTLGVFPANVAGPTFVTEYAATAAHPAGTYATRVTRKGDRDGDGDHDANDPDDVADLTHDSLGRLTAGIDADWHAVSYRYDAVDRVVQGTDARGQTHAYRYDANGNLEEDKISGVTRQAWGYDYSDRQVFSVDNANAAHRTEYDANGNALRLTDPDGYVLAFEYDAADRWLVAMDKTGNAVSRSLDGLGRPLTVTDPEGHTTRYAWHPAERGGGLQSVTLPQVTGFARGRQIAYTQDAAGNVVKRTETGADGSSVRDWRYDYDELNRLTRQVGPAYTDATLGLIRPVTRYTYDALGRVTRIQAGRTDSAGVASADTDLVTLIDTVYDDFGRKLTQTDPLGNTWRWTWDAHGNVLTQTDAKNQKTEYQWTPGHLLKTKTVRNADGSVWRTYTYTRNPLGQATRMEARDGTGQLVIAYDYTYDAAHRLASVTDSRGGKTLTYHYSPGGLLDRKEDSDGNRTDYLYDAVGRLIGIWLPNYDYVAYSHDAAGRRIHKWQSEGGIDTYYAWNADGSLAGLTNYANATALTSHSYGYDAFGRKASATEYFNPFNIAWTYGHDPLDRITEVRYAFNGGAQTLLGAYRYDVRGNRTRNTASNGSYRVSVLDAAQRLTRMDNYTSAGAYSGTAAQFQYDANGDLTRKQTGAGTLSLAWDPEGRLATAATSGTGAVSQSYLYDDSGRRISKTSGATTTHYLYDGEDLHAEYQTWASPQAVYVHGAQTDEPIAKLAGATDEPGADARYYHADGMGNITAQTQGGTLYGWVVQDPWGVIQLSLGGGAPIYGYSYHGRERDETGLVYFRNRYYDPLTLGVAVHRFISRDPLGPAGGASPYAAFGNDPLDYADPDGLMPRSINPFGNYSSFSGLTTSTPPIVSSGKASLATISNPPSNVFNDTLAGRVVNSIIGGPATTLFGGANNINPLTGYINQRPRVEQAMDFVSLGVGPELKAGIPLAGGVLAAVKEAAERGARDITKPTAHTVVFETKIAETGAGTREAHKALANRDLAAAMSDKEFSQMMSSLGVKPVNGARTPEGFIWHHAPDRPGVMQLVPEAQHTPGSIYWDGLHPGGSGGFARWGRTW